MGKKQKKIKMADSKNNVFQNRQSSIFFVKISWIVLGLVELIDVKGIDVAQSIWP